MSYNPLPQPADVVVISAGSSVTEVNRFPVGIGSTGLVSLKYSNQPISFSNPLPVSLGSSNITITGDVNVGTTVSVTSSPQNPVHNHITEVGTSDILNVPYLPVGIGTTNLNLTYLPVGISTLLNIVTIGNTVSISNTAFYVTNPVTNVTVGGTVSVANTVSISNTAFYVTNPVTTVAVSSITSNVTVQGTVGIGTTGHVTIDLNNSPVSTANPFPVSVGNTITVQGSVTSIASTTVATLVKYIDETNTQLDSANRLRVAQSGQQYYYTATVDKDGDLRYNETFVGTGCTSKFVQNLGSIRATSGISTNGYYRRGSRRRFKFRPGISHQWTGVINWNGRQTNCTKRRGVFTQYNGIFFEVTDDLYAVIRRRLLDGTLVEDRVKRTDFNQDTLNGQGPSGMNFDRVGVATITGKIGITSAVTVSTIGAGETHYNVTYSVSPAVVPFKPGDKVIVTGVTSTTYNSVTMVQSVGVGSTSITLTYFDDPNSYSSISNGLLYSDGFCREHAYWFDFNGDRTCRVRFGVETGGGTQVLHIADYSDTTGTQFSNAPAMMDRTEIFNTGITSYAPSIVNSGTSFNIEAEVELNPSFGIAQNLTPTGYNKTLNEEYALLGIGLRYGEPYQRADLQIQKIMLVDTGNLNPQNAGVYYWRLLFNPTIGGTGITTYTTAKATQYWNYTSGTTFSGGTELLSGFASSIETITQLTALNFVNMGSNLDYTNADKIVLVVKLIQGGSADGKMVAAINFIENL